MERYEEDVRNGKKESNKSEIGGKELKRGEGVGGIRVTYAQQSHTRFSHLLIGEKEKSPLPSPPLNVHRRRCN